MDKKDFFKVASKYLKFILKEKYNKITEQELNEFKIEVCKFYDNLLITPYDKELSAIRKDILFTTTDLIELIEKREEGIKDIKKLEKEVFDRIDNIYNESQKI